MTTASAPRGSTPPVAMAVAVPGATSILRRMAAGDHFGVERQPLRRDVACAGAVGRAQREAVDVGAVERRRIDRGHDVFGEHAVERLGKRHVFAGERREIEVPLETRARLLRRNDFEELLLPRRRAHPRNQVALGLGTRLLLTAHSSVSFFFYGHGLTATVVPSG